MDRKEQIDTFCRYSQVSRETITSLKKYEKLLIEYNKKINLIGKSTVKIKNTSLYLFIRNRIFCFNKNIHGFNKLLKSIPFIFMNLIVLIKYLFTNKFNIVIMAIFDGFLNKSKPINYILNKYG